MSPSDAAKTTSSRSGSGDDAQTGRTGRPERSGSSTSGGSRPAGARPSVKSSSGSQKSSTASKSAPKSGPPSGARPGSARGPRPPVGGRRVRLAVSRIDPWSVLKTSFLLSVAIGVAIVVSAAVLWTVLDGMGIFADIDRVASDVAGSESGLDILDYLAFERVISLATVIAVVDVVLLTALATLGAFLYNLSAGLVGGLSLTLSDD